jgi:hypothetical protein
MRVAIIGASGRNTPQDRLLVEKLIAELQTKHSGCLFVTTAHSDGVGKFVREKCLEKDAHGQFKYQLALINIQLFVSNLPRAEVAALYQARNPALLEIADVFYYLANSSRTGMLENVIEKAQALNRPVHILMPDGQ